MIDLDITSHTQAQCYSNCANLTRLDWIVWVCVVWACVAYHIKCLLGGS